MFAAVFVVFVNGGPVPARRSRGEAELPSQAPLPRKRALDCGNAGTCSPHPDEDLGNTDRQTFFSLRGSWTGESPGKSLYIFLCWLRPAGPGAGPLRRGVAVVGMMGGGGGFLPVPSTPLTRTISSLAAADIESMRSASLCRRELRTGGDRGHRLLSRCGRRSGGKGHPFFGSRKCQVRGFGHPPPRPPRASGRWRRPSSSSPQEASGLWI